MLGESTRFFTKNDMGIRQQVISLYQPVFPMISFSVTSIRDSYWGVHYTEIPTRLKTDVMYRPSAAEGTRDITAKKNMQYTSACNAAVNNGRQTGCFGSI